MLDQQNTILADAPADYDQLEETRNAYLCE